MLITSSYTILCQDIQNVKKKSSPDGDEKSSPDGDEKSSPDGDDLII